MSGMAAGAAIGASSEAVGGAIGMGVDAHVRGQNWSRQKRVMQEKYQWAVRDLRAAGLNPILAATGQLGPGPSPNLQGSNAAIRGLGGAAIGGAKMGSEVSKNKALTEAATAQSLKANEEALNAKASREYIHAQARTQTADAISAAINAKRMAYELPKFEAIGNMWLDPGRRAQLLNKHLFDPKGWVEKVFTHGGTGISSALDGLKNNRTDAFDIPSMPKRIDDSHLKNRPTPRRRKK